MQGRLCIKTIADIYRNNCIYIKRTFDIKQSNKINTFCLWNIHVLAHVNESKRLNNINFCINAPC